MVHRILIIDDDEFHARYVARCLDRGPFEIVVTHSARGALELIELQPVDLTILDVRMSSDGLYDEVETAGGSQTGLPLARDIRRRVPEVRLIALTAWNDPEVQEWFIRGPASTFLSKPCTPKDLLRSVNALLGLPREKPKIFIVHGHDHILLKELKDYIRDDLKLGDPIVLAEQPSLGKTILEKFEHYAAGTDLAFVVLSPDDAIRYVNERDLVNNRSRQNVIFEWGYFLGFLRRSTGRIILLHKGPLELPSDVSGVLYIDVSSGVAANGVQIRAELSSWL